MKTENTDTAHTLVLSTEEVDVLHEIVLRAFDAGSSFLPDCTWQDDCLTCNVFNKVYNIWTEAKNNGNLPQDFDTL